MSHYISAGRNGNKYTIRKTYTAYSSFGAYAKDGHVCTVGTDWDKAVQKLAEIKGVSVTDVYSNVKKFELNPITRHKRQADLITFGKHTGKTIGDLLTEGELGYLKWLNRERPSRKGLSSKFYGVLEATITPLIESERSDKDPHTFYVGKHSGKTISEVPVDYLKWILEKGIEFDSNHPEFTENVKKFVESVPENEFTSNHVGDIGDRIEVRVTATSVREFFGDFGTSHLVRYEDEDGNAIVYMGSGAYLEEGTTGVIRGTVSKHDQYKGEDQTRVKRVKIVS